MMGKHLQTVEDHVTDITISTATVDIQVMRIGTKQMTLAVFRQLPEKDMFDDDGYLLAPPWGWVNYDRDGRPAKPFVFSYEGILYRDKIALEDYGGLTVKAETKETWVDGVWVDHEYIRAHYVSVPTGMWIIAEEEHRYYRIPWLFSSEEQAREHLANRLTNVATLKEAPQLFIGV